MPRLLAFVLGLLGAAALALALLMLLAYGTGPGQVDEAAILGLQAPVTLDWPEDGVAAIEATSEADLFAGLGYAHALHNAWPMSLRRQLATGRLSQWFPDSTSLELDAHALKLGFSDNASAAYRAMPDSVRAILDAYAQGVNAAFRANRLARADDFVLFGVDPEPWAPWHALAVEHLLAYLGTPSLQTDQPEGPPLRSTPELERFLAADSLFRSYLRFGDMEQSLAFAAADLEGGTAVMQRIVYGTSAHPLIQPVTLTLGGRRAVAASVPGTLALLGGFSDEHAWALLPATSATLATTAAEPPDPRFGRIVRADGAEALVEARRMLGQLFVTPAGAAPQRRPQPLPVEETDEDAPEPAADAPDPAAPEPVVDVPTSGWWVLVWEGFESRPNIDVWRALLAGQFPERSVLGGGLWATRDGGSQVIGQPVFTRSVPGGVLVAAHDQAEHVAERLAAADTLRPALDALGTDAFSLWAARRAPPLIDAIGTPDSVAAEFRDAVAFVGGWNHQYNPEAIGASIFEAWLAAYHRQRGTLPDPEFLVLEPVERVDTVQVRFEDYVREQIEEARAAARRPPPLADTLEAYPERADSLVAVARERVIDTPDLVALKEALREALTGLRETFGDAGASWRWDRVQRARLEFPLWTGRSGRSPGARRYRDVAIAEGGHPTSIAWGPSTLFDGSEAPAAWNAWTGTADWEHVRIHARVPYHETPTERYTDRPEPAPTLAIPRERPPQRTIRLLPAE